MPDVDLPARAPRLLLDPWERSGPILLDGPLERPPHPERREGVWLLQALLVLGLAFVLFQAISSVVAVVLLLAGGVPYARLLPELMNNLGAHVQALMIGNTLGQVLGLALPALLVVRLHTRRGAAFLRFRPSDAGFIVLAVLGLAALTPLVQWLGQLNSALPMPDWVKVLEQTQMQLIEQVLDADTGIVFNLVVLALTPAFCEELLFRGYVQRQAERALQAAGGILFSGVFFGLYHLRLSQLLPLSVLGIYLAYLVWRTGSLWPAIVVHFANNAFAILMEAHLSARPDVDLAEIEQMDLPWYLVAAGAACLALVVGAMQRRGRALTDRPGAAAVDAGEPQPPTL